MGGPAAKFKAFADATVESWFAQAWRDKLAAGFTVSGTPSGDKFSTLQYFHTLAMQHGMIWVGRFGRSHLSGMMIAREVICFTDQPPRVQVPGPLWPVADRRSLKSLHRVLAWQRGVTALRCGSARQEQPLSVRLPS